MHFWQMRKLFQNLTWPWISYHILFSHLFLFSSHTKNVVQISIQAYWLRRIGLRVPFKIFRARLGLLVQIYQIKNHFHYSHSLSLSIYLSIYKSLLLYISLSLFLAFSLFLYIFSPLSLIIYPSPLLFAIFLIKGNI